MVAILSRIFTGPNINFFSILGLCIMVLGGIVCFGAGPIISKIKGGPANDESVLPVKLAGLVIVAVGFIVTIYLS